MHRQSLKTDGCEIGFFDERVEDGATVFEHKARMQLDGVFGGGNAGFEEAIGGVINRVEVAPPTALFGLGVDDESPDEIGSIWEKNKRDVHEELLGESMCEGRNFAYRYVLSICGLDSK
jgi:hypothetical protein